MENKALNTACKLCDTMMRKFENAADLPPAGSFHYHQGVFLSGMMNTYKLSGDEKYYNYIKSWVDSILREDGTIKEYEYTDQSALQPGYDKTRLDDIQPGILLFTLYEKTGEEKYIKILNTFMDVLRVWKKNKSGGFWHKECHPNQMWLDSIYMGGPIQAEFAQYNNEPQFLDEAINQALIMFDNMYDEKSGLMVHAWDESKEVEWADPVTGLSSAVWGRAFGWFVVALLDILQFTPENHPKRARLIEIEQLLLNNIIKYRDPEQKRWYQVVNKGDVEGNWIETSCSALFTAALAKAIRMNVIDDSYKSFVEECFDALDANVERVGEDVIVNNVCVGTGVCDMQGYFDRPTSANDLHGVGSFLLMCTEVARIL